MTENSFVCMYTKHTFQIGKAFIREYRHILCLRLQGNMQILLRKIKQERNNITIFWLCGISMNHN